MPRPGLVDPLHVQEEPQQAHDDASRPLVRDHGDGEQAIHRDQSSQ